MKEGKFSFAPIPAFIGLSIAALAAWPISYFSGFGFWPVLGITAVAMLINGFIAIVEDNTPGGFNNPPSPDNEEPPPENIDDKTRKT
jgi:hypothetical protein